MNRTPLPTRRPNITTEALFAADSLQIQMISGKNKRRSGCFQHTATPNRNGSHGDHVMAVKSLPSPEVLRQLLRYEPDTGKLFWLPRSAPFFKAGNHSREHAAAAWNAKFAGKAAFTSDDGNGYRAGSIFNKPMKAHRVAYAIHHGFWPTEVDHINGDRSDNRAANLRDVTHIENGMNQVINAKNTSGAMGVYWDKRCSKWYARIVVNQANLHLGYFADFGTALEARLAAEAHYGFHPNHGRAA